MERFWSKVDKSGECWLWMAAANENGYGVFSVGGRAGRMELAPRVAWQLTNGSIPEGMHIRHRCDTPACVRPDHLLLGTPADNTADKVSRDRQAKGSAFPHAVLTEADVVRLRSTYAQGGATQRQLAERYGVSQSVVCGIVRGDRWKHVA